MLVPDLTPVPAKASRLRIGILTIAALICAAAAFAVISYLAALRGLARGEVPVRRSPTEMISSRLRRRRQGFAVDTGDTPAPPGARRDPGDPLDEPDPATAVESADAVPGQTGPTLFDEPLDEGGEDEPSAPPPVEDETPPPSRRDRRVVIDPTNL